MNNTYKMAESIDFSKLSIKTNYRKFDINKIDINKINIDFDISIKSKSLILSDKLNIALVLIDKMNEHTVQVFVDKINSMGLLSDVLIKMLREACLIDLNTCKRRFIELSQKSSNSYIYKTIIRDSLSKGEELNKLVMNTIEAITPDIIDMLIDSHNDTLIFNIFRKTANGSIKEYIYSNINKISNNNVKLYITKMKNSISKN